MTVYYKDLIARLGAKYGEMPPQEMARKLFDIGVIDHTLCKVLAVREEYVAERIKRGDKKIDAMWYAAENFSCTYEYVRKCIYYYTDVNFE